MSETADRYAQRYWVPRGMALDLSAPEETASLRRHFQPGPKPRRLCDMKGSEAVVHMLKDARRRLCPKMERWDQASLYAFADGGIVRV